MSHADPFIEAIKRYAPNPKLILDIGSMDGAQAEFFKQEFPDCRVVAFEPHPKHIALWDKNIELVPKAVSSTSGRAVFHAIEPGTNSGGSSLFRPKSQILSWDPPPKYDEVEVDVIRLADWMQQEDVVEIDAIWMDVQGAELAVLGGLGPHRWPKVIATECETSPVYDGKPTLFPDLSRYMHDRGMVLLEYKQAWEKEADLLYVRRDLCST